MSCAAPADYHFTNSLSWFHDIDAAHLFLFVAWSPLGEVHCDNSEAVKTPLDPDGHRSFVDVVIVPTAGFCVITSALSLTAILASCS